MKKETSKDHTSPNRKDRRSAKPGKTGTTGSSRGWPGLLLVVLLGLLIYSNSFDCSFQFDDKHNITENPAIRDLAHPKAMWDLNHSRFLPFYSFALNYRFNKLEVGGYHAVNLIIHLLNSCLVWWLVTLLFAAPAMKENRVSRHAGAVAWLTALLFVSHPLATGSVTYIVQRMASMVALFYFLTVALYLKGRLSDGGRRIGFFAGAAVSALLAVHTKENAYTLPFAVLLVEFFFIRTGGFIRLNDRRIWFAVAGLIAFAAIVISGFSFSVLAPIPASPTNPVAITPANYFFTQLNVIVKYLQLLIVPVNQNLDYDFPLSTSLFELPTILNGLLLLSLLITGVLLFRRNRLISFGIFWFLLTLSIESGIIPIADLIFEHRTYIPSFGFFLILSAGGYQLLYARNKGWLTALFVAVIGINSVLAFQRNKVWKNEIIMWSDVISKSPNKARAYVNRGYAYGKVQQWDKAIADFTRVTELEPERHAIAYYNLGLACWSLGQKDRSLQNYTHAIRIDPKYADACYARGIVYFYFNMPDSAFADLTRTVEADPRYDKAYFSRGIIRANRKEWAEAIADYSKAIGINAGNASVYYNRALVYGNSGEWEKAVDDLNKVLELDPSNADAASKREYARAQLKNKTQQ